MTCNKKFLQLFAAIWILTFHIWIPVTNTVAGSYLMKIGYIGVDLFFFLAAYSLSDRDINYISFLKNRFFNIYLRFMFFVAVAAIYGKWNGLRILKVVSGIEFLQKGGGSFLWYLPAIMIFYLIYPLLAKIRWKLLPVAVLAVWLAGSIISERVFAYTDVFIFTNRIPVIVAGCLVKKYKIKAFIPALSLPAGLFLLYQYGFMRRLNAPIRDFYFVFGILVVVGIVWLSGFVRETKVINFFGAASLEMYALQMIFGPKLVTVLYKAFENKLLTNLVSFTVIIALSLTLSQIYIQTTKFCRKRKSLKNIIIQSN